MMLNETLAEKKIHICIFPKSSQQRCNIFKNASIFLKNLGCNIYAFDAWYNLVVQWVRAGIWDVINFT